MFEPIGVPRQNTPGKRNKPVACIVAGQMMLEQLARTRRKRHDNAIKKAVKNDLKSMAAGKMGMYPRSRRPGSRVRGADG